LAARSGRAAAVGGAMIVTADHGNCEVMVDPETGGPHTAHTLNPVPWHWSAGRRGALRDGRLSDIAPTVLAADGPAAAARDDGESLIDLMLRLALALWCLMALPLAAQTDPAEAARAAARQIEAAALSLQEAESARDRVRALTETVQAYEAGLAAMRDGLRRAALGTGDPAGLRGRTRQAGAATGGSAVDPVRAGAAPDAASRGTRGHGPRGHDRCRCHAVRGPRGAGIAHPARGTGPVARSAGGGAGATHRRVGRGADGAGRPVAGHRRPQNATAAACAECRGDAGDPSKRSVA
jgi:hypothetical protein